MLLVIARDSEGIVKTCLECMEGKRHPFGPIPSCIANICTAHAKPDNGNTCDRPHATRPFKGLYDWVWTVRQTDEEDPDLDDYVLWREFKKQVRILREELENERDSKR